MNLIQYLQFGGPGSGCNPAAGHCGRLPTETEEYQKLYTRQVGHEKESLESEEDVKNLTEQLKAYVQRYQHQKYGTMVAPKGTTRGVPVSLPETDQDAKISPYVHHTYTSLKTTGKSWTGNPSIAKGYFQEFASRMNPKEGEATAVYHAPGAAVVIYRTFKSLGAPADRLYLREVNHDPDGYITRTRTRVFTQVKAGLRALNNRYGITNPWGKK
ncbi:MAG: hypothetical protein KGI50_07450 [Patescibacteria group bacterium]|nr:hypothetical protein [Patescibacteria group bacterium]MDE2439164.1 hypothetical protein [Patescibacteria group bacterium]